MRKWTKGLRNPRALWLMISTNHLIGRRPCTKSTNSAKSRFQAPVLAFLAAGLLGSGCRVHHVEVAVTEAKVSSNTVTIADPGQLAALTVEPISAARQTFVLLSGRLVWDEHATVRVFSP